MTKTPAAFAAATAPVRSCSTDVPDLGYQPVPDIFNLPEGMNFGACSSIAINSRGHIFVLHRGQHALMEFDGDGRYIRSLADGMFSRPHGLRIDAEDNIWPPTAARTLWSSSTRKDAL